MIKLKEILTEAEVSRELWYHINHNISLEECVFRYGSPKYFTLINEARLLQCEQNIDFDNQTRALLETDLGKFGMYEGKEVALDFPLINHGYLNEFVGKELEARNEPLYNKLVPGQGDAETVEGEILRAMNRIAYRYYNDGDKYFQGYGTETAGPAHSFLVNANHPLKSAMIKIFGDGTNYEQTIKDALDIILDYIESRQGKYTKNTLGGIFNYEPEFEDDEEDYEYDYDDEDEDDYMQESINEETGEVNVFGYQTKHFDVCPGAQSLYKAIVDGEHGKQDKDLVIRVAKAHDTLFYLEKLAMDGKVEVTPELVDMAQNQADLIMSAAKEKMDLEKEHNYVQGHVDKIKDQMDQVNEASVEVDDDTEFSLSLKHLLDKHIIKKDD